MGRHEEDREDLFAELRAYSLRWELRISHEPDPVVIGQRQDGRLAVYFGPDPCFHFNGSGLLLRAFAAGALYRTQGTCLARLQRQRTPDQTQLVRSDLQGADLDEFLNQSSHRLRQLAEAVLQQAPSSVQILRATDGAADALSKTAIWISESVLPLKLAPAYPTRRQ